MEHSYGAALVAFDQALRALQVALSADASLSQAVFGGAEAWIKLLEYKLLPHLSGEGVLIVAIAGGTNCGKSTVFNLLLGEEVSPIRSTAAATRQPVIAANRHRVRQCLEGRLVPEFVARLLTQREAVVSETTAANTLFVWESDRLGERLILLDTPDIDSIDVQNWEVAESIRAAGDVMVAVLTGEKYKDERVVQFFRWAARSGRVIVPLMNKADPRDDFDVARRQLDEFQRDIAIESPGYILSHNFEVSTSLAHGVPGIDGQPDLLQFLHSLDVPAIKKTVYRDTVAHFAQEAGAFVERAEAIEADLAATQAAFRQRAEELAEHFDPMPGAEVGGLFHAFVQARRGPLRRAIGRTGSAVARGAVVMGRAVRSAFSSRAALEPSETTQTELEIRAAHARAIEQIARELLRGYVEACRGMREPSAHLLAEAVQGIVADRAVQSVVDEVLGSTSISSEFRAHADRLLDAWWNERPSTRRSIEALDLLLAASPIAIAVPMTHLTGGFGVAETVTIAAGPFAEQFLARVAEYQFGDRMFDFLSPWRADQRRTLAHALLRHIAEPCLKRVSHFVDVFDSGALDEMKRSLTQCPKA